MGLPHWACPALRQARPQMLVCVGATGGPCMAVGWLERHPVRGVWTGTAALDSCSRECLDVGYSCRTYGGALEARREVFSD
jgi:hypothetical protein